jgi:hypothetical protein
VVSNGKTITHFSALGQTVGTIRAWQIPLAGSGALDSKKTVLPEPYAAFQSRLLLLSFYPFILLVADHLDTVGELEINRQRLKSSIYLYTVEYGSCTREVEAIKKKGGFKEKKRTTFKNSN